GLCEVVLDCYEVLVGVGANQVVHALADATEDLTLERDNNAWGAEIRPCCKFGYSSAGPSLCTPARRGDRRTRASRPRAPPRPLRGWRGHPSARPSRAPV